MIEMVDIPRPNRRQLLHDALLAFVLGAGAIAQMVALPVLAESGRISAPFSGLEVVGSIAPATPLGIAIAFLAFASLALRRIRPLTVLVVTVVADAAFRALVPNSPASVEIASLIALYTVATLYPRRVTFAAACGVVAVRLGMTFVSNPVDQWLPNVISSAAVPAVFAAVGDATRSRRAYVAEVERRAVEAERTREEEALRRVEEERLRIARELHDVTAHTLSVIAVQAGAAEKVADRDPESAKRALQVIRSTSRGALDELRSIVGVLRGAEDDAPLAPVRGLAGLPELVGRVEGSGVDVILRTAGDLEALPTFIDLSAYRIIQEALTNVLRHAGARAVSVTLERSSDVVTIEVTDDGRGPSLTRPERVGHGLIGMRERVLALGGEFEAGLAAGGGYRVHATLPFGKED